MKPEGKYSTARELVGYGKLLRRMSRDERLNATHNQPVHRLIHPLAAQRLCQPFRGNAKGIDGLQ